MVRGVSSRSTRNPAASGSTSAKAPSIACSSSSARGAARTSAATAARCCAASRSRVARAPSASPRTAALARSSSASVTPAIAETTTTRGAGRCARMTDTACAMAAPFASEAPPNLWISRGRLERGMVNLKNSKARAVRAAGVAF